MSDLADYKYYDGRDHHMDTEFGKKEIDAVMTEIDDARTEKENPKVLEVGCGSGMAIRLLTKNWLKLGNKKPLSIKGIDINEFSLEIAKGRGVEVSLMDATKTSFKNGEFDVSYGMYVLQDVEPIKLMEEMLRISKKAVLIYLRDAKRSFKPHKITQKSGEKIEVQPEQVSLSTDNIKRFLRQISNERHTLKELYRTTSSGGNVVVDMIVMSKIDKVKEVENHGVSTNRNSSVDKR